MAQIPICNAPAPNFELTGHRCELRPGHNGPHGAYVWREWTDEDKSYDD